MKLALAAEGIVKTFSPVTANAGASLSVREGEIHAVVGENGAGKSTLMRIISGMYTPDAGTVKVNGNDVTGWSTAEAIAAGVGMVHQHFMLVPTLTVAENVVLGSETRRGARFDRAGAIAEVERLSRETGLAVPATRRVDQLTVGEAQRVEILKALYRGARILILDEPTAVLSPPEVDELWRVLRQLREQGTTVVVITHKLVEVMAISERVTVMRHGRTIDVLDTARTSPAEIAGLMVGRAVELEARTQATPAGGPAANRLVIRDLSVRGATRSNTVQGFSLTVEPGEIVGIAGVEGNGQTELIEAIAGLRAMQGGEVSIGRDVLNTLSVRERTTAGLAHVPEDRHLRGLILDYTTEDNLILGLHAQFSRRGVLDRAAIRRNAEALIREFDIRPQDPIAPARALSGGNQQKIVIAREMGKSFRVLLAAQPTRGVDVGAIEFIHARIRGAAQQGKAVLVVSADLGEILALSQRIVVMYGGRAVADLSRAEATEERIGRLMTGAAMEAA